MLFSLGFVQWFVLLTTMGGLLGAVAGTWLDRARYARSYFSRDSRSRHGSPR